MKKKSSGCLKRLCCIALIACLSVFALRYFPGNVAEAATMIQGLSDNTDYYIMNAGQPKLLSPATTSPIQGTGVVCRDLIQNSIAQWRIELQSNGKYAFWSVYSTHGLRLSIAGTSAKLDIAGEISSQQFTVTRVFAGKYAGLYIIQNGSYYLTMSGTGSTPTVSFSSSITENCYWSFMLVEQGFADLYSFNSLATDIVTTANNTKFVNVYDGLYYTSSADTNQSASYAYLDFDEECNVFVFCGHGNAGVISFSTSSGPAGLIAVNSTVAQRYVGGGTSKDRYIDSLAYNAISDMRCVLYLGCSTGSTITISGTAYNLVSATFNKGAHFVFGPTEVIYESQLNSFLSMFLDAQDDMENIEGCIEGGNFASYSQTGASFNYYELGDDFQYLGF